MAAQAQVLEIEYATARDFAEDYRANLSNGGVFVATEHSFQLRDFVVVRLRLPYLNRVIDLEGEVVHMVPAAVSGIGGKPGVAVQFREPPAGIRGRLAPLCGEQPAPAPPPQADESRVASRKPVRVAVQFDVAGKTVRGRTRNLSRSGVLIDVQEGTAVVGARGNVTLSHPTNGASFAVDGGVVRIASSAGRVSALAVKFDPAQVRTGAVDDFIERLQESEHARRLGAISGPIAELGPQSIVRMFASTARRGTVFLRHGQEEGLICFDNGVLRVARIGPVTGMKALVRMLRWEDGSFEFQTVLEESSGDPPLPLEAALLEAARNIDESLRIDTSAFPLQARLVARHASDGQFTGALSKLEEALLDVAQAGFTVQRALEVIPEPEAEIFRALRALIDVGMVELH